LSLPLNRYKNNFSTSRNTNASVSNQRNAVCQRKLTSESLAKVATTVSEVALLRTIAATANVKNTKTYQIS